MNDSTLQNLNKLSADDAVEQFRRCCGTTWWCEQMAACRPFADIDQVHDTADAIFEQMAEGHWLEAFAAHPKIGDADSLRMKYVGNKDWSAGEQSGMDAADDETIDALAQGNADYEKRFGYILIVCASGKSAGEMLQLLRSRLRNDPPKEAAIACGEQRKITHLRLDKLAVD